MRRRGVDRTVADSICIHCTLILERFFWVATIRITMTDKNNREKRERDCFLAIDTFVGPYAFLSNTFHSEVFWDGHLYPCVACAIYATQYELTEEEVLTLRETWIEGKIPTHVKLLLQNESHKVGRSWCTSPLILLCMNRYV